MSIKESLKVVKTINKPVFYTVVSLSPFIYKQPFIE